MPKGFAIVQQVNGMPNVNFTSTPVKGFSLAANLPGQWGLYLFSGTVAQLTALNALIQVYGLCAMTESDTVRWAELDIVISSGIRTKINTWLTARGYPTVPAGWTYRQVVQKVYEHMNQPFNLQYIDVLDN
jgi:hypothetical protein